MKLPGGGYAPRDTARPGTPPAEPAGASSTNPAPCTCRYPQDAQAGSDHATINQQEGAAP